MWLGLGDASAGLGLHHPDFLPKSLSAQKALFFRRYRRDISEAHFREFWRQALPGMPAMLGPRSSKRCKYRQKTAVLSGELLFCPFCFCSGWLACCAALAFFALVFGPFGARATQATKRCYLQCFVAFAFPGWLAGCSFWAAVSAASGARARDPM